MDSPDLLKHKDALIQCGAFHAEEFERAEKMLKSMNALRQDDPTKNVSSTGAYTSAVGIPFVRENVCRFIEKRDGLAVNTIHPSKII
jgi:aspartate/methionine/tyrosine aminotransferase